MTAPAAQHASRRAPSLQDWLDALCVAEVADLVDIYLRATPPRGDVPAGVTVVCHRCPDPILHRPQTFTLTGAVRHLRVSESKWRAEHLEDGPNAGLHRPGDLREASQSEQHDAIGQVSMLPTETCGRPGCDATVVWAKTSTGGRLSVDAQPHAEGTVVLALDKYLRRSPDAVFVRPGEQVPAGSLHRLHRLTCTNPWRPTR